MGRLCLCWSWCNKQTPLSPFSIVTVSLCRQGLHTAPRVKSLCMCFYIKGTLGSLWQPVVVWSTHFTSGSLFSLFSFEHHEEHTCTQLTQYTLFANGSKLQLKKFLKICFAKVYREGNYRDIKIPFQLFILGGLSTSPVWRPLLWYGWRKWCNISSCYDS